MNAGNVKRIICMLFKFSKNSKLNIFNGSIGKITDRENIKLDYCLKF